MMPENQITYYLVSSSNSVTLSTQQQSTLQLNFSEKEAKSMINHMNEDHIVAMRDYLKAANLFNGRDPRMTAIGSDGFLLEVRDNKERKVIKFEFPETCQSVIQVRKALVTLAKTARRQ